MSLLCFVTFCLFRIFIFFLTCNHSETLDGNLLISDFYYYLLRSDNHAAICALLREPTLISPSSLQTFPSTCSSSHPPPGGSAAAVFTFNLKPPLGFLTTTTNKKSLGTSKKCWFHRMELICSCLDVGSF